MEARRLESDPDHDKASDQIKLKKEMKNCVYQFAMSACLFLAACSGGGTKVAKLEVIPLWELFRQSDGVEDFRLF